MSYRFTVLETSLNRAEFQWKYLQLLRRLSILGVIGCGMLLLLGVCIVSGWLVDKKTALVIVFVLSGIALVGAAALLIGTIAGVLNRKWLAAQVEKKEGRLLDRLSALIDLESRKGERRADSFAYRIARQAQQVVAGRPVSRPFSAAGPAAWFSGLLLGGLALLYLNYNYTPWSRLLTAPPAPSVAGKAPEPPLDLAAPPTNNIEVQKPWGEVRITDPAKDLRVTKVDVVPLQMEAAANEPIKQVRWISAVNGGDETVHELPPPAEPRYAAYQPTLYLDELELADWDVMTYFAQASAESNRTYSSEVYFLEVIPFREDLAKMPGGGESGKPYQAINEITGLIHRQQQVVRQTHQHVQNPPAAEIQRDQDRKKLADAEDDLGGAAQHLYAKLATEMENLPIGEALDNLAAAETALQDAAEKLRNKSMPPAQTAERTALSSLVATRKMFQQAVSDNPAAFDGQPNENEESAPIADSTSKLQRMAEFRDEARVAQEFLQKSLEQQKSIEQRARGASVGESSKLSQEERQVQRDLQNFAEQHPQAFKGAEAQKQEAHDALNTAAQALQRHAPDASSTTQKATKSLEQVAAAADRQALGQQLADAYKLKRMVDEFAQRLQEAARAGSSRDESLERTAEEARLAVDQLKKMVEQEPTKNAFGQPLRDALAGARKTELDANLQKLQRADDEAVKRQAAADAGRQLNDLSKAFTESQPKALQLAQKTDALKQAQEGNFALGLSELESLLKQLQDNRQLSKEDQAKQAQQALSDLRRGLRSQFGESQQGNDLLAGMEEHIKAGDLNPAELEKLLDDLRKFSVETFDKIDRKEDQPKLAEINSTRLPPAYRGRIQKYFEKLSER